MDAADKQNKRQMQGATIEKMDPSMIQRDKDILASSKKEGMGTTSRDISAGHHGAAEGLQMTSSSGTNPNRPDTL